MWAATEMSGQAGEPHVGALGVEKQNNKHLPRVSNVYLSPPASLARKEKCFHC